MQEAIDWFVRHDAGDLSEAEKADFEAWLAADPRNQEAYTQVGQLWSDFDRVPAQQVPRLYAVEGGKADSEGEAGRRRQRKRPGSRGAIRWKAFGGVAASIALLVAALATDLPLRLQADALTSVGERKVVTLPDGSSAFLNTNSAIAIDYGPAERRVRLLSGEAEFTVAEGGTRPFLVEADGGLSTALGTVFLVRRHQDETTVTVLESRVSVSLTAADVSEDGVVLKRNEQVSYTAAHGVGSVQTIDPSLVAAWKRGKLIFSEATLGAVITELNRYHRGQIIIRDQRLRAMRVNGVFETDDPVAIVNALEASLDLNSTRLTDMLILLHR